MQFPIKLAVTSITRHHDTLVETRYDAIDAAGEVIKQSYFYCKPSDVEEVCAYTLERLSLALAQPKQSANVSMGEAAAALLATMRSGPGVTASPPDPTPLDQTVSPPGVAVPKGAGK